MEYDLSVKDMVSGELFVGFILLIDQDMSEI